MIVHLLCFLSFRLSRTCLAHSLVLFCSAIWKVAQEICITDDDDEENHGNHHKSSDDVWTSLLIVTSTRARPVSGSDTTLTPPRLKLYVLSNLLDCAVQCANVDQRRTYIQRIMKLPKATQKVLMGLIEKRSKKGGTPSKKSPGFPSSRSSSRNTPSLAEQTPPRTGTSGQRVPHSTAKIYGSANTHTPPPPPPPPLSADVKAKLDSKRLASTSPGFGGYATPNSKGRRSSDGSQLFPSPVATPLDSPHKAQKIVYELRQRNEQLQAILDKCQQRETEYLNQLDQKDAKYRQNLLKIEAKHMDTQHELQQRMSERIQSLESHLTKAQDDAAKGREAMVDLKLAKEELDLQSHKSHVLAETTEKLRKYKDKVAELQDVKEALAREQEAHAQAVDEMVRLESENQGLQTVKLQLEEYKIRAIEAEVKLVEYQDYLRRLEQKASDQSIANEYLWKGALMQKEQLEELQRRVQQDTPTTVETPIGDGISELNPQLMAEIVKLRHDNKELIDFKAKRQGDEVEKMECALDDAKRLADRYKIDFLQTKEYLEDSQAHLAETKEALASLEQQLSDCTDRSEAAERENRCLQDKLNQCKEDLDETKQFLKKTQDRANHLEEQVEEWIQKTSASEQLSKERFDNWQDAKKECDETNKELEQAGASLRQLQEDMTSWEIRNKELEVMKRSLGDDLQKVQEELSESQARLGEAKRKQAESESQIKRLTEQKAKLQDELEEEKRAKHETMEEAHRSLQATREVLLAKCRKDVEDVKGNMNCLLDDERRANRRKDEEFERKLHELNNKWKGDFEDMKERLSVSLKHSREEAQDRIEYLKGEYEKELLQAREEADIIRETLMEKGRIMLEEAKSQADELIASLKDEARDLEKRLTTAEVEKEEVEKLLRAKVNSLKQKLDNTSGHIGNLSRETDELQEKIKVLERERYKLQEDNDRYRRQLGGRFGADSELQPQLENMQKEYNALLQENRNLKSSGRRGFEHVMAGSSEEESLHAMGRGGSTRSTISQLRREYEETIEALNDEKRELVMRNTAAMTDVQKAEQRAWEREHEVSSLQSEITSLKLALARREYANEPPSERRRGNDHRSPNLSFLTANEELRSSPQLFASSSLSNDRGVSKSRDLDNLSTASRSPSIDRAMKHKLEQENLLRTRISSLSSTPPRVPRSPALYLDGDGARKVRSEERVLSPTRKHENSANTRRNSFSGSRREFGGENDDGLRMKLSSDYRTRSSNGSTAKLSPYNIPSLMEYGTYDDSDAALDGKPECQQS